MKAINPDFPVRTRDERSARILGQNPRGNYIGWTEGRPTLTGSPRYVLRSWDAEGRTVDNRGVMYASTDWITNSSNERWGVRVEESGLSIASSTFHTEAAAVQYAQTWEEQHRVIFIGKLERYDVRSD